jgi:hypothetical protein
VGRDLKAIGASDWEAKAYLAGLERGNVILFATGTTAQTEAAMRIMNQYYALEVEEFVGATPGVIDATAGTASERPLTGRTEENERSKSEGARVFSW